ncbi:ROK family transcriptional regulator [Saccharopolyspora sp. CA-218241]|uniref:ROK family transcriptional regulator n=1 Tax=Saccharopolyspora sp. CA-218241 TaxID=3240027 RepID=UPI003D9869B0
MAEESWQGTNLPRVGGFNRAVVLDAIRRGGGVSRVELAQRTGLTAQTMSNIVRALIADGLVSESGHAPSTGGKRRVLLQVVPEACSAVGLHLDPERITGVLLDLAGGVRHTASRRVPAGAEPAAVISALARTCKQLVSRVDPDEVLGAGLAVPGPLDAAQRTVLSPPNLTGWPAVPLADAVSERTGLPVVMDNDATAAAIGERWAGGEQRAGSFAYAYLGSGVGLGVVLADRAHRGVSGNAGEIGHVPAGGTRLCHCGRRGCLEAYCSMRAIVADSGGGDGGPVAESYARLCRRAAAGEADAVKVLRQAATRLGRSLAAVVGVLDVDRVVLGGPALRHVGDLVRDRVAAVLDAQVWAPEVRPVRVQTALIGEHAGAVGAASLVLDRSYSPRLTTLLGAEAGPDLSAGRR